MSSESKSIPSSKRLLAACGVAAAAVSIAVAVPQLVSSRDVQRDIRAAQRLEERGLPLEVEETLETYRAQYLTILANLHQVAQIYDSSDRAGGAVSPEAATSKAVEAMEMIQDLTDAELTLMMDSVPDLTAYLKSTDDLLHAARTDQVNRAQTPQFGFSRSGLGGGIDTGGFPSAPYSNEVGSTRPSTAALLAASAVFETAEGVREVASRGCDEVIVGIGIGGNLSLVCIATDAVFIVAKTVFWALQFESDDVDSAEINGSYIRTEHLHEDIEDVQTGVDAVVPAINAHDANIDADLVSHDSNLSLHDANIDADLVAHDANIDADLVAHDANIDADLIIHDVAVQALLGNVQGTLDNEVELRRVHLQVIEIVNRKSYMVVTTEAGAPVDVIFNAIQVYDASSRSFAGLGGATVAHVDMGIYVIDLNLPGNSPSKIFRVKVEHADVVNHFGQVVFHRDSSVATGN